MIKNIIIMVLAGIILMGAAVYNKPKPVSITTSSPSYIFMAYDDGSVVMGVDESGLSMNYKYRFVKIKEAD